MIGVITVAFYPTLSLDLFVEASLKDNPQLFY